MKKIIGFLCFAFACHIGLAQNSQSQNLNYTLSNVLNVATTDSAGISARPADQVLQTMQYYDGLGRAIQVVTRQGSPLKNDVVQPIAYDLFGRKSKNYLPYVSGNDGTLKADPIGLVSGTYTTSPQYQFYNNGSSDKIIDDTRPFTETMFEASELNRSLKDYGAGIAWAPTALGGDDKFVYHQNLVNSTSQEQVIAWVVNGSGMPVRSTSANASVSGGYYTSGQLAIKSTKDEQGNEVREYTDKIGQVVLKKVQATTPTPALTDASGWAQTYYIYDDLGQLRYVLQPELTKTLIGSGGNPAQTDLDMLAFQYQYDGRKRMVQKQVPGAKPVSMIYDKRNRLVMTQDGNQRLLSPKEWTFTKYDAFNRPVLTGTYQSNSDASTMQGSVDSFYNTLASGTAWYETYIASGSGNVLGYDNKSFPQVSTASQYLTATYYDVYDSFNAPSGYTPVNQGLSGEQTGTTDRVNGMVTATQVKNLTSGAWMRNVSYYDARHRVIQTVSDHQKGTLRVSNVYDFTGKVLTTLRAYTVNSVTTSIRETFIYDHAGRVIVAKHSINGGTEVALTGNYYNEVGQLVAKGLYDPAYPPIDPQIGQAQSVHAATITRSAYSSSESTLIATQNIVLQPGYAVSSGSTLNARIGFTQSEAMTTAMPQFAQVVDYGYNIRGWMTRINNADISTLADGNNTYDYFGMELTYNTLLGGFSNTKAYNGNISAIQWSKGYGTPASLQGYALGYDPMNRLKDAFHYDHGLSGWFSNSNAYGESQTYDLNGNIQTLVRKGFQGRNVDNLGYHYLSGNSNQLAYVDDSYDANAGFINANTGTDDYAYDDNGNLYKDKNKGIANNGDIQYNYLNLPKQVTKGSESIKYTYDATGRKLTQEVYSGATLVKTTDYIGELVLENNAIQFIQHAEGRAVPGGGAWEYQYHLKDHLGNVRVSFTTKPQTATNYGATMETGLSGSGEADFGNYSSTNYDLVDHTDAGTTYTRVQWLNGGANGRVGLTKSLVVMPGDQVTVSAYAKYMNVTSNPNPTSLAVALASAFNVSSGSTGDQLKLYNGLNNYVSLCPVVYHTSDDGAEPKAFVTILFFDKDYNLLDAAWDQIGSAGAQTSGTVKQPPHDVLSITAKAPEAGYAYIFLSNEDPNYVDVYFDDVNVSQTPSPIFSVSDYYPFGLTYNSYQRENSTSQKFLYNGKENINDLALNWDDYGARMYMPEIGRWMALDGLADKSLSLTPYRYGFNNPIKYVDPNGFYETDGHYWTVYLMATIMGSNQARNIAYSTEYPDNVMSSQGDIMSERWTWTNPFYHQWAIHSLTGARSEIERGVSATLVSFASTVGELGEALHRLGDSFAHTPSNDGLGRTYSGPLGHLFDGHWPDKIANRPDLYLQYVKSLEAALSSRLGYQGSADLFTFEYVAGHRGTTEENSAILETEVRIREGQGVFTVAGNQVSAITDYLAARNQRGGSNINARVSYGTVDTYTRDKNGKWQVKTEHRTIVAMDNE